MQDKRHVLADVTSTLGSQQDRKPNVLLFLPAAAVVILAALPVQGGIVGVEGPESAFIYRTRHGVNLRYPTSELTQADEALANVYNRGYVDWTTYRWREYPPTIWQYTEYHFSTYIRSALDQTLIFRGGGDDGASLFVDGDWVAGTSYGHPAYTYTLNLTAGEVYKITYAGYNAGGGFDFWFVPVLRDVKNLEYNADGFASGVPEPTTLAIWSVLGFAGVGVTAVRKRRRKA